MSATLLEHEPALRLSAFLGLLGLLALWEAARPRRARTLPRWLRWGNTLALVALDTLLLRLLVPVLAVGLAAWAEAEGRGLFNVLGAPAWVAVIASLLLLDLLIYTQHRVFHAVPVLWRLHRVHHADTDLDVVTALRFHPVEILLSMGIKLAAVAALGAPPVAVLVFEVTLNACALFNHANLRLPAPVDRVIRWVLVTPDMHRVHHSIHREETDSNFGFSLSWWDRLLGTYTPQPAAGHDAMILGQTRFRAPRDQWLDRLLLQPWRGPDAPAGRPVTPASAAASRR
ncbi:sterol desaturase family protein [Roseospira visakhapatnamensis]|uniref:Sterol desaturase/sphingolipid hydroxylase (Fatty acid hydroxylase superfamily) n=1 Tax=Roseospira visakhapatnamensis TaxID=390880 RepID=A0A7W6RAV5_9PROT|nr:sterol desaturase family protein [Roseospira visakhapatnamensis]MBB4264751.1 sterol desaturase/sphingolipid hydroxylase (fatty acid hydroxylase superfamily) [Roseospira visakhapatnamensis]